MPKRRVRRGMGAFAATAVILAAGGVASAYAQPGLSQPFSVAGAPYIGDWQAHGEHLTVNPDGTGTETYRNGTVNFRMSSVQSQGQPNTAYGNVTGGGKAEPGSYVTMQLVDGGNGLLLSVANGDNGFPFCKVVNGSYANSADCGA